ncbi:MAG: long-chain fatty acid--CoA ligase [Bacteroidota bacterium]
MKNHLAQHILEIASQHESDIVLKYKEKNTNKYQSLTWKVFADKIKDAGISLLSHNISHNSNVGIFSDNKVEWTLADIAILSVRAVTVPIYATSSFQQLKYIVDETQMELLFVGNNEQAEKAKSLFNTNTSVKKIVVFDELHSSIEDSRIIRWNDFISIENKKELSEKWESNLQLGSADDLATIVYTSGTTGEPKGAMLKHSNFLNCLNIHDKRLIVDNKDVSLCFLPLTHIFERTWTFYMLHRRAINVYLENPKEVINAMTEARPTVMCVVPRFFEKTHEGIIAEVSKWSKSKRTIFNWALKIGHKKIKYNCISKTPPLLLQLKHAVAEAIVLKKLRNIFGGNIRFIPCAGAAINNELLRFFHATGLFINYGYGTTETTATVSCFKNDIYDFDSCGSIMPEIDVKITDEGEICVKGTTVFSGYYKKEEETKKVLIDGWYHTGDKGFTKDPDFLVMTDRIKDLFKTSLGKYVSPQKIELLLSQDAYIQQVIAIGDNKKFVTALIVPSFDNIALKHEEIGIGLLSYDELVKNEKVIEFFNNRIIPLQKDLAPYEKVIKFELLAEPFSIENNELTNTLKIKRRIVVERYKEIIENFYK